MDPGLGTRRRKPDAPDEIERNNPSHARVDLSAETAPNSAGARRRGHPRALESRRSARASHRMIGSDGEVLYVGKARSVKKRIASYMRGEGHTQPHRADDRAHRFHDLRFTGTKPALLLETNLIKTAGSRASTCARCATTSRFYILLTRDHVAPQIAAIAARATASGRLLRPLRLRAGVHRTLNAPQRACSRARVRILLREPHAPLPAVPDGAARGPAPARFRTRTIRNSSTKRTTFCRQEPRRARPARPRHGRSGRRNSISNAPRACATASPRCRPSRVSGRQSGAASRKPTCSPSRGSQPVLRGNLFPHGAELGNRAYFPRADRACRNRKCSTPSSRNSAGEPPLVLLNEEIEDRD